ncbi:hypothetical protein [Actinocrispum wychmicini]|uniref:ABC-2 family transporter n=1 Tax=Actinocrispum wychmicini TaxID=1213861 RepID=A0A4R2JYF2_9PSEU|nr:hypothetical protein [Actinocrispum wychmicini]TCO64904.1 hypothetical protein EV192_101688 [Actinocrispum wychmicini]
MIALVRYLVSDVVKAQRWIAPMLAFLAVSMIATPTVGPVLPTYAISAATLLPISMWFTIVVFHNEEPAQGAITMAVAGGFSRVWPAKLVAAFVGALAFVVLAFLYITVSTFSQTTPTRLGIGILDYVMCAVTGVAFGALISRPVMPKVAWTVLTGVAICLAQLLIRHAPPVNAMIQLYAGDSPAESVGQLLLIAAESLVLAAVAIGVGNVLARARS